MKLTKHFVFFLVLNFFIIEGQAQKLKLNLDETGKTYIKGSLRGQFWARYYDTNPGTTVNGDPTGSITDFSIRRIRANISAQLTPKIFVYALLGGNNINSKTEKDFEFDILDFYAEYEFSKAISIGMGESSWDGLDRWNVRSSKSLMALDAPLFSLLTVNKNDDLARGLGAWAKGQIGKFDYILAIKSPTTYGVEATEGKVDFALNNTKKRTSGYVKYEFWDNESNKTAYSGGTGTYLGKKKLLNLGAGFMLQPDMTSQLVNGIEEYYDYKNWAIDAFLEFPLNERNAALTSYLGFFNTNFGPNYIRNLGANDIADSSGTSFNGGGNDYPMMGTGETIFFQLGYLLPKFKKSTHRVQPNIAVQYSDFDALDDPMVTYDLGINYYLKGHSNKLTLGYQDRPIFNENELGKIKKTSRRGMLILQYQIEIN
ncbi:hypothetical protein UJ101_02210 [Flavobacteriaceae bacterium UJ101]|nr:hypothetical protein UJ101_02210 [Flavobacteriaceae bacterium UJ101]